MSKVIVTGSEGFIGNALVATLRKHYTYVYRIDRKLQGIFDVTEAKDIRKILEEDIDVDCVYHLAAQTSVFNKDREAIMKDNIETFMEVCDACKDFGVRFIYASSSTANAGNSTSLYGISKRFDEEYARCYYPEATGIRFHNVYGSYPREGTLLWCLLNQELTKLYNRGMNRRHFTHISDIVAAMMAVRWLGGTLWNARNPEMNTVLEFACNVKVFKDIDFKQVEEIRELDRFEQTVDEGINTVPLCYKGINAGLSLTKM